jgi:agmatine deiminase
MPAEWTEHECTFVSWPLQSSLVYPDHYADVCLGYATIITAIAAFEPVVVLVQPQEYETVYTRFCAVPTSFPIILWPLTHQDAWLRDNGPTFVCDAHGHVGGVRWQFNAWGEKYPHWERDNAVAPALLETLGVPFYAPPIVMEGGSFHVDGQRTLLTTTQCLLHPSRNPTISVAEITALLKQALGVDHLIWLDEGWHGDETDGHIDNVACFAAPGTVLLQVCTDPLDPHYALSQRHIQTLTHARDACGRAFSLLALPQPPARWYDGKRLTLSYINFSFVNDGILVPVFGGDASHTDRETLRILRSTFPTRKVVPVDGMAIVKEGGNIHCITQQLPKGNRPLLPRLRHALSP